MFRAAIGCDPVEEYVRVEIKAVRMQAAIRPGCRTVAPLGVAIGMLGTVRADDACPPCRVRRGEQQALTREPGHHVVGPVVREPDRARAE